MSTSHQISLPSLTPREAVADTLHRCIAGIDDDNRELWESCCLKNEDISIVIRDTTIKGWTAINEYITSKIMPLRTTHFVTNVRVNLTGEETASMTAHALAYHIRPEDAFKPENTSYTTAGLYFMDLVKDKTDGLWKISKWTMKLQWTEGSRSVITG